MNNTINNKLLIINKENDYMYFPIHKIKCTSNCVHLVSVHTLSDYLISFELECSKYHIEKAMFRSLHK